MSGPPGNGLLKSKATIGFAYVRPNYVGVNPLPATTGQAGCFGVLFDYVFNLLWRTKEL